jgi:hypothetical protein
MKFGIGLFGMQTHPTLNYSNKDIYDNTFI